MSDETKWVWVVACVPEIGDMVAQFEEGWKGKEKFKMRRPTRIQAVVGADVAGGANLQMVPYIPMAFKIINDEMMIRRDAVLYWNDAPSEAIIAGTKKVWATVFGEQQIVTAQSHNIPPIKEGGFRTRP